MRKVLVELIFFLQEKSLHPSIDSMLQCIYYQMSKIFIKIGIFVKRYIHVKLRKNGRHETCHILNNIFLPKMGI